MILLDRQLDFISLANKIALITWKSLEWNQLRVHVLEQLALSLKT